MEFLSQKMPEIPPEVFGAAFGIAADISLILPFSRLQENEADKIGMILMAQAGYNPEQAIEVWGRMAKSHDGYKSAFFKTHPTDEKRIENMREFLPEAVGYYQK